MTRTRIYRAILAALFAVLLIGVGATVALATTYQPHMASAKSDLQSALNQLNASTPDKGGHRDNAISLVKQAITQVNAGMNYASK